MFNSRNIISSHLFSSLFLLLLLSVLPTTTASKFMTAAVLTNYSMVAANDLSPGLWIRAHHCPRPVDVWIANGNGCQYGRNRICQGKDEQIYGKALPYNLLPGESLRLSFIANLDHSVKISWEGEQHCGQFEYSMEKDRYSWDYSQEDGAGASMTGNPLREVNVVVTPVGMENVEDRFQWSCRNVVCPEGKPCNGVYQKPDDHDMAMRQCPLSVKTFIADVCGSLEGSDPIDTPSNPQSGSEPVINSNKTSPGPPNGSEPVINPNETFSSPRNWSKPVIQTSVSQAQLHCVAWLWPAPVALLLGLALAYGL